MWHERISIPVEMKKYLICCYTIDSLLRQRASAICINLDFKKLQKIKSARDDSNLANLSIFANLKITER